MNPVRSERSCLVVSNGFGFGDFFFEGFSVVINRVLVFGNVFVDLASEEQNSSWNDTLFQVVSDLKIIFQVRLRRTKNNSKFVLNCLESESLPQSSRLRRKWHS